MFLLFLVPFSARFRAESVLPLFVSSGLVATCVSVLRDDLSKPHDHHLVEADPKRHTTKLGPWDALVEAVMRLLLNISVNDAGAFYCSRSEPRP